MCVCILKADNVFGYTHECKLAEIAVIYVGRLARSALGEKQRRDARNVSLTCTQAVQKKYFVSSRLVSPPLGHKTFTIQSDANATVAFYYCLFGLK